jgi:hypothetical protein
MNATLRNGRMVVVGSLNANQAMAAAAGGVALVVTHGPAGAEVVVAEVNGGSRQSRPVPRWTAPGRVPWQ